MEFKPHDKVYLVIERDRLRRENNQLRKYIADLHSEIESLQANIDDMKSQVRDWDYIYIDDKMGIQEGRA